MPAGLYGKLPAKRDFVAVGASRGFLGVWEPWMQSGLSASRHALGSGWQAAFLSAPIWRFWLGAGLCGAPVLGAFMPSVDGIGRYFPLTLFDRAAADAPVAPPEYEAFDAWFGQAEQVLLSALAEGARFEDLAEAAAHLPSPAGAPPDPAEAGATRTRDGTLIALAESGAFARVMAALRHVDRGRVHAGMSYWWTAGGDGFPARAAACAGMPAPDLFAGMLTGVFEGGAP